MRLYLLPAIAMLIVPVAFADVDLAELLPRTPEGRPDFHGVWESRWRTPLNRPQTAGGPSMTAEEHAALLDGVAKRNEGPGLTPVLDMDFTVWIPDGKGNFRTSQVVEPADGRVPLTEAAGELFDKEIAAMSAPADSVELRPLSERCLSGVGAAPLQSNGFRQIVQTLDHLMIQTEMHSEYRIVAISGEHRPAVLRSYEGDSIAWWEGEELVVETTHARPEMTVRGVGFIVRPGARVMERFRLSKPDEITYSFTVEDREMYEGPWRAEFILIRASERMYDTACHENNYSLVHILQTARVKDAAQ